MPSSSNRHSNNLSSCPKKLDHGRQLEEENRKLKQIVADLSLDKAMLQAVVAKKL